MLPIPGRFLHSRLPESSPRPPRCRRQSEIDIFYFINELIHEFKGGRVGVGGKLKVYPAPMKIFVKGYPPPNKFCEAKFMGRF